MTDEPVNNLTDEQIIAAAASMSTRDFSSPDGHADGDGYMLLRFAITDQPGVYGIRPPLPSSSAPKPWLYAIPTGADDAASMLATFIDEEVSTGCVKWARTTPRGGHLFFELAPYGFTLTTPSTAAHCGVPVTTAGVDPFRETTIRSKPQEAVNAPAGSNSG